MAGLTRRRSRTAPSPDACQQAGDVVAVRTGTLHPGGLRIDWGRFSDDEASELVALVREADHGTWLPARLGKKQRRYEELVEKGADAKDVFESARLAAEIDATLEGVRVAKVKRPIRKREEPGLLAALADQIMPEGQQGRPFLWLDQAGLFLAILLQIHSGRTLAPRSRVERDTDGGSVLVFDSTFGLLGEHDPRGAFANQQKSLQHLEANGWLVLGGSGAAREIRLGTRALQALGDLTTTTSRAA